MASKSVVRNPVNDGYAVLTPQIFRAIDLRARQHAGSVFEISTSDEMHGTWGLTHMMAGDVFIDLRKLRDSRFEGPICDNASVLTICNQVRVAEFHRAQRPEIDLAAIPAEHIYDYVSWHEIGHVVDNFDQLSFLLSVEKRSEETSRAHRRLNEILADRFAWSRIFPDRPLPVRKDLEPVAKWADEWVDRFTSAGIRRGRNATPVTAHPLMSVPVAHVRKGVKWSSLYRAGSGDVAPLWLAGIKRAQSDVQECDLRRFQRTAHRMAERWARIAENPTAEAMEYNRKGIIASYLFDEEKAELVRSARESNDTNLENAA